MADKPQDSFDYIEPISPLFEMAIVLHETFQAFRSAGFTEPQAMQLISLMLSDTIEESNPDE